MYVCLRTSHSKTLILGNQQSDHTEMAIHEIGDSFPDAAMWTIG